MSTAVRWCPKKDTNISGACGICLEPLRGSAVVTPCQHLFCHDCIYVLFSYGDVQVPCPCCRKTLSPYSVFDSTENKPLKEADFSTPFGNTFVQLGRPGLASYHLNSLDNCYLSYENAPECWKMDDGAGMPRRKELKDVVFDKAKRQLTARVDWSPGAITGASEWRVVMRFDEGYRAIFEGEVALFRSDGTLLRKNFFGSQLRYRRVVTTIFGSAFIQGNCPGLASYHFVSEDDCYISYARAFECWRLDDGSKPPLKKPFNKVSYNPKTRVFKGIVEWEVPFDGEVQWEYEMVFSPCFERIVDGTVSSRRVDGTGNTLSYKNQLSYQIYYPKQK